MTEARRGDVYELLAQAFLQEPTEAFVGLLREQDPLDAFADSGPYDGRSDAEVADELAEEYTRLFIGPGKHIPPYGSVHSGEGGTLYGKTTAACVAFVKTIGLEYNEEWHGLPDHIGAEFQLMARLAQYECEARDKDDNEMIVTCLGYQKEFLDTQLGGWVPPFCDRILVESESVYYRKLAEFTKAFIVYEVTQVQGLYAEASAAQQEKTE